MIPLPLLQAIGVPRLELKSYILAVLHLKIAGLIVDRLRRNRRIERIRAVCRAEECANAAVRL